MKKIFVTGATGRTGINFQHILMEQAEKLGDYYFCFALRANPERIILDRGKIKFSMQLCDLSSEKDLDKAFALQDFDSVLHIAGISNSVKIVGYAVRYGVKRIILVHTTGMYSKYKAAGQEYRQIEWQIRELIKDKDIKLTILRPTMIYGSMNDQNISVFIKMVDKLRLFPVVNNGKYALQPVHANDLGRAYYQVLVNDARTINKDYNLSGGSEIFLINMFKRIEKGLGRKNIYVQIPFFIAYIGSVGILFLTLGKKDYREKVQRMVEPRVFSHAEATSDFGFNPRTFEDGIKDEIKEYLTQKNKDALEK